MSTFYVYLADSLDYLGAVDAADRETAGQLAAVLWAVPLRVLTWRLQIFDAGA
jgi:hypothetical protein